MLINVNGIKYIPEATRATVYRKLARNLRDAKDTVYGWGLEYRAAKSLAQAGAHIPSIELSIRWIHNSDQKAFTLKNDELKKIYEKVISAQTQGLELYVENKYEVAMEIERPTARIMELGM